jgi:hypothetical protein
MYARLIHVSVKVLTRAQRFHIYKCINYRNVLKFKGYAIDHKSVEGKIAVFSEKARDILLSNVRVAKKKRHNQWRGTDPRSKRRTNIQYGSIL